MKISRLYNFLIITVATLIIWVFSTWPLPTHITSGIPARAYQEHATPRYMIPGDHLQLLYHFKLASSMLVGNTPLFYNLYEFNTGNDKERYEPGPYYIPFSLIYTIFATIGGDAFGWNMTGILALFFTLFLTWHLVRRYVNDDLSATAISIISILLPYQWVTLLGGSPTGLAMSLVPLLLLGLDIAVRDEKWWGGLLAGTAIIFSFCSDLHVFFFSVLAVPIWCIIAFLSRRTIPSIKNITEYKKIIIALVPTVILILIAFLLSRATASAIADASMSNGRTLSEVAGYSPHAAELYSRNGNHITSIYIGYIISFLILAGYVLTTFYVWKNKSIALSKWLAFSVITASITGIVFLALGTNGPEHGALLKICRKIISPYKMIRQSAKIYCLLPSFLAVAAAFSITSIFPQKYSSLSKYKKPFILVLSLLMFFEYISTANTKICLLDNKQKAYAAVINDSTETSSKLLALVLPLWPGDSHWSSLYQYDASLYWLRLINGYRPAVPNSYMDDIFKRFESFNQGIISDNQLDNLLHRGCKYILIHEDAFPEKVSPFPISLTITRLLTNPRLELLEQDERVRSFKILNIEKTKINNQETGFNIIFPARLWYKNLDTNGTCKITPRAPVGNAENLHWDIRLNGKGTLNYTLLINGDKITSNSITTTENSWHSIKINTTNQFFTPTLLLNRTDGNINLNVCILNAGKNINIASGEILPIPAAKLFHGGYSDAKQQTVTLSKEKDPASAILYASLIMLPIGEYTLTPTFETTTSGKTELGTLCAVKHRNIIARQPVTSDDDSILKFTQKDNLPVRIEFNYNANSDIIFKNFLLKKVK